MNAIRRRRILAVDIHACYIGFGVLEEASCLIDWGLIQFKQDDPAIYHRAAVQAPRVIARFRPDAVVITMPANQKLARERILRVRQVFAGAAERARVPIFEVDRVEYLSALQSKTRYAAALRVAERYPALAARLQKPRKSWQSERPYMAVFNAVAAGTAYFLLKRRRGTA